MILNENNNWNEETNRLAAKKPTKFFTFDQNNTGGTFIENDDLRRFVIIEAKNSARANSRAEAIGIYFDGCEDDIDCPCCGDRWYRVLDDDDGYDVPHVYGTPIGDPVASDTPNEWLDLNYAQVVVHYADGRKTYHVI